MMIEVITMMNGYEYTYLPDHARAMQNGCVYNHILVVEEMLGRPLTPDEVVHHKDYNRSNNSKENLIVFRTNSDHKRFHKTGALFQLSNNTYVSPVIISQNRTCPKCGAIKYRRSKLCTECRKNEERLKNNRPSKEELIKLLSEKNSREKIGRMYSVSGNAVKKWQKKFGLL